MLLRRPTNGVVVWCGLWRSGVAFMRPVCLCAEPNRWPQPPSWPPTRFFLAPGWSELKQAKSRICFRLYMAQGVILPRGGGWSPISQWLGASRPSPPPQGSPRGTASPAPAAPQSPPADLLASFDDCGDPPDLHPGCRISQADPLSPGGSGKPAILFPRNLRG